MADSDSTCSTVDTDSFRDSSDLSDSAFPGIVDFDSDDSIGSNVSDDDREIAVRPMEMEPHLFDPLPPRPILPAEHVAAPVGQPPQTPRIGNLNWCECDGCQMMLTEEECTCCREIPQLCAKLDEEGIDCIINHPGFAVLCLNVFVLNVAWLQFRHQYGHKAVNGPHHKQMCHVGYRQLVRWCWGFLGRDIRVVLPSCAVSRTRAEFMPPGLEEYAVFSGFKEAGNVVMP